MNVFKKWHMAYHGTVPSVLRRVLDTGDLVLPGTLNGCLIEQYFVEVDGLFNLVLFLLKREYRG